MSNEMEWRSTTTVAKQPPTPPLLLAGYRLDVAPWLLIGEEDEPQFSDTYEYLIRFSRYHLPARPSDEVGDKVPVNMGIVTHFMFCATKRENLKFNWKLIEYVTNAGGQITSLCKVRMDCPSLKTAKSEVKRCEKVLDVALIELRPRQLH
ncbi:hypothetical protein Tco_0295289 [Tanacetum coccineum]